jgi:hypothetical protein
MKKIIIALGIALATSTAALAQSNALDVANQQFTVAQQSVDYEATASIGASNPGVDATEIRDRLGDGSPMVSAAPFAPIAIETGYLTNDRLGGNS